MNHLRYKGYIGSIEYSKEDNLLYGKVLGIKSLISYEGGTGEDLEQDFQEAIDFYLEECEAKGIEAEKAYKGSFNVRVSESLHMAVALKAREQNTSLNSFVKETLQEKIKRATGLKVVKDKPMTGLKGRKSTAKSKTKTRAKQTGKFIAKKSAKSKKKSTSR